jgi:hypothetical protein
MRSLNTYVAGFFISSSALAVANDSCSELCTRAIVNGVLGCKDVLETERRLASDTFRFSEMELREKLQDWLKSNGRSRSQAQILEDNVVSSVDSLISSYKFQEANNLIGHIILKFDRSVHALQDLSSKRSVMQGERVKLGLGERTVAEITQQIAQARTQKLAPAQLAKLEKALQIAVAEQKLQSSIDVLVDFIARNFLLVDRLNELLTSTIQRIESDPKLRAKYDRPNTGNDFVGKLRDLHRSLGDPIAWKQEGSSGLEGGTVARDFNSVMASVISETRLIDRLSDFDATGRRNDQSWKRLSAAEIVDLMKPFQIRFDRSRLMKELDAERDYFWASIAANASVRQIVFQVLRKGTQTVPWLAALRSKDWRVLRAMDNILSIYDYELNHSWKIYDVVQTGYNEAITPANRAKHQANRLRDFANELGTDGAVLLEYFYRRTDTVRFRKNIEKAADDLAKKGETAFQQALSSAKSRVYASDGSAKQPMLSPTDPSFRRYVKLAAIDNLMFIVSGGLMYLLAGNFGLIDNSDVLKSFDALWSSDADQVLTGSAANQGGQSGSGAAATQDEQADGDSDGLNLVGGDSAKVNFSPSNARWTPSGEALTDSDAVTSMMFTELSLQVKNDMMAAAARGDQSAKQALENWQRFNKSADTIRFE